ncbi:hypothetical protein CJU89_5269 [Yarrowia sp. B02]|nr:hypothetical protein CJU89_5269 [Yarrowia sp. B02]
MQRDGLNIGNIGKQNLKTLEWEDQDPPGNTSSSDDHMLLQAQIHKMVSDQTDEMKSYILVEANRFSQHLARTKKSAPKVVFNNRLFRPGTANKDLPPEIQTMIYSHSDLESCVNLRQVSRSWYSSFKGSEEFFENKVKERFPWMYPEDEMNTWALCALVFVCRLHSKKWQSTNDMTKIANATRTLNPLREIAAVELECGEKLPKDFEPL